MDRRESEPVLGDAVRRSTAAALSAIVAIALAVAGCRSGGADRVRIGWSERGEASWYGLPFHGQRTASGERYDMYQMTAAHKELPLGTVVEVRNVENDRRVQVRINDRGPFVRGRILDLSYAAARELDMVRTGTAEIELRVIEMGAPTLLASDELTVQVAAFQDREHADALVQKLAAASFGDARVEESAPWFRVRLGSFSDTAAADELRDRLQRRGFFAFVTRAGMGPQLSDEPQPAAAGASQ